MDVGTIVETSGLYAALFALLACIALSVELGRRPPKPKPLRIEEDLADGKPEEPKVEPKPAAKPTFEIPARTFGAPNEPPPASKPTTESDQPVIPVRPFDQVQPTAAVPFDEFAARKAGEVQEALFALQRTYVDGLISPRGKYDVALAILNEYQATATVSVSAKDVGLTMATEAYLSATRTGTLENARVPFLSNLMKTMMTPPEAATAEGGKEKSDKTKLKPQKTKTAGEVKPPAKGTASGERRKPSSSRLRSKKSQEPD
jgi:hypothetical protein